MVCQRVTPKFLKGPKQLLPAFRIEANRHVVSAMAHLVMYPKRQKGFKSHSIHKTAHISNAWIKPHPFTIPFKMSLMIMFIK